MATTAKPKTVKPTQPKAAARSVKAVKLAKSAVYMEAVGRRKTAIARVRAGASAKNIITVATVSWTRNASPVKVIP